MSRKSTFRWGLFVGAGAALLLASMWANWVVRVKRAAKRSKTQAIITLIRMCSRNFYTEYGNWPISLVDFTNNPRKILFIQWPASGSKDGWGNPIVYIPFDSNRGYGSVSSMGETGNPAEKETTRISSSVLMKKVRNSMHTITVKASIPSPKSQALLARCRAAHAEAAKMA